LNMLPSGRSRDSFSTGYATHKQALITTCE
jgi:hypothetical protein